MTHKSLLLCTAMTFALSAAPDARSAPADAGAPTAIAGQNAILLAQATPPRSDERRPAAPHAQPAQQHGAPPKAPGGPATQPPQHPATAQPPQPQQPAQAQPPQPQHPATAQPQQPAQAPGAAPHSAPGQAQTQPQMPQTPPGAPQRGGPAAAHEGVAGHEGGQEQHAPPAAAGAQPQPRAGATAGAAEGERPHHLDSVRADRREVREGNRTVIHEANRTIITEGGLQVIRADPAERLRFNARDVRVEHRGNEEVTAVVRPDGTRIVTRVDDTGRLVRRSRIDAAGREVVLIDNKFESRGPGLAGALVTLPPPVVRIAPDLYVRDAGRASAADVFSTLTAPPVDRVDRRYALEEITSSEPLRARMPRVDVDSVNFATGSWDIAPDQADHLASVAQGIARAVQKNPTEMFLVEGYTDAVGTDVDNLSLSDRRAEAVALMLTNQFNVPAENLTTQGYGKQFPKIASDGPEPRNRRVAVRRITPLLNGGARS